MQLNRYLPFKIYQKERSENLILLILTSGGRFTLIDCCILVDDNALAGSLAKKEIFPGSGPLDLN